MKKSAVLGTLTFFIFICLLVAVQPVAAGNTKVRTGNRGINRQLSSVKIAMISKDYKAWQEAAANLPHIKSSSLLTESQFKQLLEIKFNEQDTGSLKAAIQSNDFVAWQALMNKLPSRYQELNNQNIFKLLIKANNLVKVNNWTELKKIYMLWA